MDDTPGKPRPGETSPPPNREPGPNPASPPPPAPPPGARNRGRLRAIFAAVTLVVILAGVLVYYFIFIDPYESTDDAFVEAHVTTVSPRVPGFVTRLLVDDNQQVKLGEPLVELDASDYQAREAQSQADLATAQAQLEQAKAQIAVDEAKAEQQRAALISAQAESERAAADLKRFESAGGQAVSQSQLDLARTAARSTAATVQVVQAQSRAADAQVALSKVSVDAASARVKQAQASLDLAKLNVSYTQVTAATNGRVTQRTVEPGLNVQAGQALMALVPNDVWIVANFKETQLTYMRPNQPVEVRIDAYPGHKFKGHVDSIQSGTGSRFSLLPPENAVGNYVKVVQRVPVKIVLDEALDPQLDISPGMSVEPKVKVK